MTTYQKVLNVYAMLRSWISAKMSKYDVAPAFQEGHPYNQGDLVIHDDTLYLCKKYYPGGSWPQAYSEWFTPSTVNEALKSMVDAGILSMANEFVRKSEVTGDFSDEETYYEGDLVFYGINLYRCKNYHASGSWDDGADFEKVRLADVMSSSIDMSNIAPGFVSNHQYKVGDLVVNSGSLYRCIEPYSGEHWPNVASDYFQLSNVEASLEMKANRSDIGYNLVTPGEWTHFISDDSSSSDDPEYTVEGPIWDVAESKAFYILNNTCLSQGFDSSDDAFDAYELDFSCQNDMTIHARRDNLQNVLFDRSVNHVFIWNNIESGSIGPIPIAKRINSSYTIPSYVEGKARRFFLVADIESGFLFTEGSLHGEDELLFVSESGGFPDVDNESGPDIRVLFSFLEVMPHVMYVTRATLNQD